MKSIDVLETLELAASDQWGIISTGQAIREGASRLQVSRLADRGVLQRARHGIYYLPSVHYEPATEVRAAWVSLSPKLFPHERWNGHDLIVVSHESAAALHKIGGLIAQKHTFTSSTRKQTNQSDIKIYSNRSLEEPDFSYIDGLPVTSVDRTVADLAAEHIERDYLATLVADALAKEGVYFKSLATRLTPYAKHYGAASGEELVRSCHDEASSIEQKQDQLSRVHNSESIELIYKELAAQVDKKINAQVKAAIEAYVHQLTNQTATAISTGHFDKILELNNFKVEFPTITLPNLGSAQDNSKDWKEE